MNRLYTHAYESPVGTLYLAVNRAGSVVRISYVDFRLNAAGALFETNKYACGELEFQLDEYFRGQRRTFTIPLEYEGTDFQRSVWDRLRKLNYGDTITYGNIAAKIGRRFAARAVGGAVAQNPIVIVVPCHRVVPAGDGIGNYAKRSVGEERGRKIKEKLLELER